MMPIARTIVLFVLACGSSACMAQQSPSNVTRTAFDTIMKSAVDSQWKSMPIGSIVINVAKQLIGKPYVGGTLETPGNEICTVNLEGLDCVTLFESSLNIARIIQQGKDSLQDLVAAVTYTRYRDGALTDYTSRLHYTSEWIDNNVKKGVVDDVTASLGGKPFPLSVGFMSQNPKYYPALVASPSMVDVMRSIEQRVNTTKRTIIPKAAIADIEDRLQDGDIVAIATSKKGLDYSHTGLIVSDGKRAHFLHASSVKKKVVLDGPISEYLMRGETNLGITILRPLPAK